MKRRIPFILMDDFEQNIKPFCSYFFTKDKKPFDKDGFVTIEYGFIPCSLRVQLQRTTYLREFDKIEHEFMKQRHAQMIKEYMPLNLMGLIK